DRDEARARVPIEIGLGTNLIGPPVEIARRLRQYRDCGVDTIRVSPAGDTPHKQLDCLAQLLDIAKEVNADS
ncbi:MAG: F420-dependent methylene-tetrahydromethanopterin reductase, partial [Actinobacteria bacterium]|nr:F420-dependent methylene-tetrahydromethanopterin reductase [Actinomycetota bacterium]